MFDSLAEKTGLQIETILASIDWTEYRDSKATDPGSDLFADLAAGVVPALDSSAERRFRHCAVISHLYALFEYLVEATIDTILDRFPSYYSYTELSDSLRQTHRTNVGVILQKLNFRQFRKLEEKALLDTYLACVKHEDPWRFVPEAIRYRNANLRSDEVNQQFGRLGIGGFWDLVCRQKPLIQHTKQAEEEKSAAELLDEFIELRNESGHGLPDDLLGFSQLRQWCYFIRALCESIRSAGLLALAELEIERGSGLLGKVTETFPKLGNIAILTLSNGGLSVGDTIYSVKPDEIRAAKVNNLQLDGVDILGVSSLGEDIEVGIESDVRITKNSRLVLLD